MLFRSRRGGGREGGRSRGREEEEKEEAAHRLLGPLWSEAWKGMEGLWRGASLQAVSGLLTEHSEVGLGPSSAQNPGPLSAQQYPKGIVRVPGCYAALRHP